MTAAGILTNGAEPQPLGNPGQPAPKRKRKAKGASVASSDESLGKASGSNSTVKRGGGAVPPKQHLEGQPGPKLATVKNKAGSDRTKASSKSRSKLSVAVDSGGGVSLDSDFVDSGSVNSSTSLLSDYLPAGGVGSKEQCGWSGDVVTITSSTLALSHVTLVRTNVNPKYRSELQHVFPKMVVEPNNGETIAYGSAEGYPPDVQFTSYVLSNLLFDFMTRRYSAVTKKEAHFTVLGDSSFAEWKGSRPLNLFGCEFPGCKIKWGDGENWRSDGWHRCPLWGDEATLIFSPSPKPFFEFAVYAFAALVYSPEEPSAASAGCINVVKKKGVKPVQDDLAREAPLHPYLDVKGPVFLTDLATGKTVTVQKEFTTVVGEYEVSIHLFTLIPPDRHFSLDALERLGPVYVVDEDGELVPSTSQSLCRMFMAQCTGDLEDDEVYHHSQYFRDVHGVSRQITVEATSPEVSDMLANTSYLSSTTEPSVVANQMLNKALLREKMVRGSSVVPVDVQSRLTVAAGLSAAIWVQQQASLQKLAARPERRGCCYRFFYRSPDPRHVLSPTMVGMPRRRIVLYRLYFLLVIAAVALGVGLYYGLPVVGARRRLSTAFSPFIGWSLAPLGALMCAWFVRRRRAQTQGHRLVLPRVCIDASQHGDVNIKMLNRNLIDIRIDRDVLPALNAGDLGLLPCQPRSAPPCVQKGPASGTTTVGFHQCLRTTMHGIFGRTLVNTASPDPAVLTDFQRFVRESCFPEAIATLEAFRFDYQEWFEHLESARKRESTVHFDKLLSGRPVPEKPSKAHVKIDEKHDMSEKLARPRVIVAAAPARKPLEGPFFYALESVFDCYRSGGLVYGIDGYCGRKNWEELGADVTDAWLNILDPVFLCYDVSAFDASQHSELMEICDVEFYKEVLLNPYVKNGIGSHYQSDLPDFEQLVTSISTDAVAEGHYLHEYRALVEWLIDGTVPSGRNNTTEGNTRRSCWYFRYAIHLAGVSKHQYRFWAKGDDLLAVVDKSVVEALKSSLRDIFAESAGQTKGLGMLLKRIEIGGVNDFDFLSARAFFNGRRFFLVRDPGRYLAMTPWTISIPKWESTRECFVIMRDLQWSEYNNIISWAGSMNLPLFMPYARLLLAYAVNTTVGHDRFKQRNENEYVVLSRSQVSGDPSDSVHFRRWLFDKFGVTSADLDAFESLIDKEIDRVRKGLGDWEYDGNFSSPVPMNPAQFDNPVSRVLLPNTLRLERPTTTELVPDKFLRERPTRRLKEVDLEGIV